MRAYRIGAAFYALWGLLHVVGGATIVQTATSESPNLALAMIASATPSGAAGRVTGGAIAAVLAYYGWLIVVAGLVALIVALKLNWVNSKAGYWFNLGLVGGVDAGLLAFLLLPGYMAWTSGGIGLALFVLAAVFSTLGRGRL